MQLELNALLRKLLRQRMDVLAKKDERATEHEQQRSEGKPNSGQQSSA
jgi:hypothetical protein